MTTPATPPRPNPTPVIVSVRIGAPPDVVFPYFTDPVLVTKWIAQSAELDARPGGLFHIVVEGNPARGAFVEVDPPRRVVFTWGIDGNEDLPPGTSTVEVVLVAEGDGTLVTLTHRGPARGLPGSHQSGWSAFLGRLVTVAAGGNGPEARVWSGAISRGSGPVGCGPAGSGPAAGRMDERLGRRPAQGSSKTRTCYSFWRRAALTRRDRRKVREAAPRCFSKRVLTSGELRAELRRYYQELLTDEVRAGLVEDGEGGDAWREVVRQIGKDGWLGIGWPTEFGGQGRPATDQFIFFDETRRAGAPFPFVTINTVGPTIMRYGTDEQKSFFLPKILAGELNFAIGYTEPEAGTDLASLRTRAVRDGDEYVVNGAKIFTSGADTADYVWLAVRTDPDVPKHKGISILCVPTSSPGFEWSIINTVGGLTTTQTFYDNVHVPVANRVGEENEGWRMITTQLNHERVGLAAW